jgi:hypothetical protein
MGGDNPLDFEDEFFGICEVEKFPENGVHNKLTKENFAKHLDEMLEYIHKSGSDQNIGYQVLAVGMLRAGALISGDLQDFMMQACENDEWAQVSEERKLATDGLYNAISSYNNEDPIIVKSKGLFEVMADKLF